MKTRTILLRLAAAAIIIAGIVLAGCKGDEGAQGPAGRNPEGAPIITAIMASPDSIGGNGTAQLLVAAYDPNGDSMSYSWTASSGVFTNPYSAATIWTAPAETGILMLHVTVTAGGLTTTDSVRVGVNMRVPTAQVAWLGGNGAACAECHASITGGYGTTGHAGAFASLQAAFSDTNNYCLQCHTTGFDDVYSFDGTNAHLVSTGPDTSGYDNLRTASLQNVQCESCHGQMGPSPLNHSPQPLANIVNGTKCAQCHEQGEELAESGHGTAVERAGGSAAFLTEWGSSGCNTCHISEGFIGMYDDNFASSGLPLANGVGCATCHDPHNKTNDSQLRTVADVTSPYSETGAAYTISGMGKSQLCATCHHARRNASNINGQINNGSAHPGPHESPQADMVAGHGDYEVTGTVNRTNQHANAWSDTLFAGGYCTGCHMMTIDREETGGPVFGHKFEPKVEVCQRCHTSATSFDVAGVQTHTQALLDTLAAYLPHDSTGGVPSAMDTVSWTLNQRKAGYTYYFVTADASKGVHNSAYATSILTNAIALVRP
jgi:hypothetical protein